jgi:predicted esterase
MIGRLAPYGMMSAMGEVAIPPDDLDALAGQLDERAAATAGLRQRGVALGAGDLVAPLAAVIGWAESTARGLRVSADIARRGHPELGPGGVVRSGDSRQPVTRAEVERQRDRDPAYVHAWWESLTDDQRAHAIAEFPGVVGWLAGVPAVDRDRANRLTLTHDIASLRDRETYLTEPVVLPPGSWGPGPAGAFLQAALAEVRTKIGRLEAIERTLGPPGSGRLLLGVDTAGDGKFIVAVGNPDTARHTAVWVPGVGSDAKSTPGDIARVSRIQFLADSYTPEIDGDVAAIMWLGYDAPELNASAAGYGRSEQGGAALAEFVDGLRATHGGVPSHVTAMGHSYGSTVVAEAALHHHLGVTDIVTAGSPGMHTAHAADLHLDPRHVWAGAAADDPIADFRVAVPGWVQEGSPEAREVLLLANAVHGSAPHEAGFGANRYHVDTHGHSDYWDNDTQSLSNQARIVTGQYHRVTLDHGTAPE